MSQIYLKVKIKSLAEEARIIRREERRVLSSFEYVKKIEGEKGLKTRIEFYEKLREHRKHPVGTESRAALIAYGFIRGKKYKQIERPKNPWTLQRANRLCRTNPKTTEVCYWEHIIERAFTLINKYGKGVTMDDFDKWISEK
jgi:hypothetical protein